MKYLKQEDPERAWILDIETDGLQPTIIWIVVVKNLKTGEVLSFRDKDEFNDWVSSHGKLFIGHNIISYDIPVLRKLWQTEIQLVDCIDTLVLSYLYNPAIDGGHSLDAWGQRLGKKKGSFSDWSQYSLEMESYCKQDVEVTYELYNQLTKRMLSLGYSELSCSIEHKIRIIIDEQIKNGVYFDTERATKFLEFLRPEQARLSEEILRLFPKRRTEVARRTFRRTKDGSPHAQYGKDVSKHYDVVLNEDESEYVCYDLVPFNLGSPKQRVERLLELGWTPVTFTPKGNPKVDEDALLAFSESSGRPEIKALAEYLVISARITMLSGNPKTDSVGWLGTVQDDHRIHGKVFSCGAASRRMTHNTPNCVPLYSQALTRNGWKFYNELTVGEDILAYDLSTKTKKWTPLLAVSAFSEAEVYSFGQQNPRKRFFCTKNHSWVVRGRDSKGTETEKLAEARELKHNRPIRINAPFDNDVSVSDFSLIQEKYGHDWVSEICKLSDPELHAMMQGFLLADGCRPKSKKLWEFAQAEGPLLDAFLTCLYLISDTRVSAVQKRKLKGKNQRMGYNVIQTSNTWMRTKDMSLKYEGVEPVWCPTTQYGTWVMKQGDFIAITGNTANVPSAKKAKYGKEFRSFWTVQPDSGLCMVGYDAKGLETECFKHWLNNPAANKILDGDIHTDNAKALSELMGRPVDREWGAKTSWYAWMFGCYPPKLAAILKCSMKEAEQIWEEIYPNRIPGLKKFIESIQYEWKSNKGRLSCIDGGFVVCPSASSALNYKIQPTGAVVMKLASILCKEASLSQGVWNRRLLDVHDEGQHEALEKEIYLEGDTKRHPFGDIAVEAIRESGRQLRMNVPLDGSYAVGYNWSQTH